MASAPGQCDPDRIGNLVRGPDRRGCGLNDVDRGDLKSMDLLFDDVIRHVTLFKKIL